MDKNLLILLQLLLAHTVTDFVIQRDKWVKEKQDKKFKSKYFYIHILIAGFTVYLLMQQWANWIIPSTVFICHGFIDWLKICMHEKWCRKDGDAFKADLIIFLVDQGLHLLSIFVIWLWLTGNFPQIIPFFISQINNDYRLACAIAVIIIIWPAGMVIGKATAAWKAEIEKEGGKDSLENAGLYIGFLERILVLIFVLNNQFEAIGFLIAGKSLLRISNEKDKSGRKKTEYVLIGSLMSFTTSIVIGLFIKRFF